MTTRVYEWKPDYPRDRQRLELLRNMPHWYQTSAERYSWEMLHDMIVSLYYASEVTFVAFRNDRMVGVALCQRYNYIEYLERWIALEDPGMRDRPNALAIKVLLANKSGLALVEAVKEHAEHGGYDSVVLSHNFSPSAVAFYAKCGFIDPGPAGEDSGFRVFDVTPLGPRRSVRLRNK